MVRVFGDAGCTDLGLDQMGTPTKTANRPGDLILSRVHSCNGFRYSRHFVGCVCSSSPLPKSPENTARKGLFLGAWQTRSEMFQKHVFGQVDTNRVSS
jgi:hypothetical protein